MNKSTKNTTTIKMKPLFKNNNNMKQIFSFFKEPITNTRPYKNINLTDAYRAISSGYLIEPTLQLRSISEMDKNRRFKATHFPYVCFSGTFEQRNEKALIKHSGLIAFDFDHLEDVVTTKLQLLKDPYFETELLFVSPNGNGLKWIISIVDFEKYTHLEMFQAIYNYINVTYSIEIDKACKDVSRATFLCSDPEAFIHPKYLVK